MDTLISLKPLPNTTLKATAVVKKGIIDVPYTATIVRIVEDGARNEHPYTYYVDPGADHASPGTVYATGHTATLFPRCRPWQLGSVERMPRSSKKI